MENKKPLPIVGKGKYYEAFPKHFSFFKAPITNIYPDSVMNPFDAYYYIKNGDAAEQTWQLRQIANEKEFRRYKATHFDYVTFGGQFSARSECHQIELSGYIVFDFDHVAVKPTREKLLSLEAFETVLLFTSPSGEGVKWVVKNNSGLEHRDFFRAVSNYLSMEHELEVDPSGKDLARACFLPYDPDVYINPYYKQEPKFYIEKYKKENGIE